MDVYIEAWSSISSLGSSSVEIEDSYTKGASCLSSYEIKERCFPVYTIQTQNKKNISTLLQTQKNISSVLTLKDLDPVHQLALYCTNNLISQINCENFKKSISVLTGSARGSTTLLEKAYDSFIKDKNLSPLTSPLTTAGNISAFISKAFGLGGAVSASMTCASFLETLFCAVGLCRSGMIDHAFVGGVEAPLTPFMISQMEALRIYSKDNDSVPCKPLRSSVIFDQDKTNKLVLGEGGAYFYITTKPTKPIAKISSIISMTSSEKVITGMSEEGEDFFQCFLQMPADNIDAIIVHDPGTRLGTVAEYTAIKKYFCSSIPPMYSTKHLTGHTFGASAALSLELALLLFRGLIPLAPKYENLFSQNKNKEFKRILVSNAGFGGICGSFIVEKI